jgi:hypothetical protein
MQIGKKEDEIKSFNGAQNFSQTGEQSNLEYPSVQFWDPYFSPCTSVTFLQE